MTLHRQPRQSTWAIFAMPIMLAVATVIGLTAGLLGDGGYDLVATLGLGLPVLVIATRLLSRK